MKSRRVLAINGLRDKEQFPLGELYEEMQMAEAPPEVAK